MFSKKRWFLYDMMKYYGRDLLCSMRTFVFPLEDIRILFLWMEHWTFISYDIMDLNSHAGEFKFSFIKVKWLCETSIAMNILWILIYLVWMIYCYSRIGWLLMSSRCCTFFWRDLKYERFRLHFHSIPFSNTWNMKVTGISILFRQGLMQAFLISVLGGAVIILRVW